MREIEITKNRFEGDEFVMKCDLLTGRCQFKNSKFPLKTSKSRVKFFDDDEGLFLVFCDEETNSVMFSRKRQIFSAKPIAPILYRLCENRPSMNYDEACGKVKSHNKTMTACIESGDIETRKVEINDNKYEAIVIKKCYLRIMEKSNKNQKTIDKKVTI